MRAIAWTVIVLLVAIFSLLTAGLARAEEMKCAPLAQALPELIQSAQRVGAATMPLVGEPAKAFLRVVNSEPPQTDFTADGILAIAPVDGESVLVFLIHKDRQEICGYIAISGELAGKALLASKAMAPKA